MIHTLMRFRYSPPKVETAEIAQRIDPLYAVFGILWVIPSA